MAPISGTSGRSSATSIYGTRNVISGLASGMDTESMIENAISGYKNKISSLSQKRTKAEWQQEAYRSIVSKMAGFTSKYADYQSSTNLMSVSFFNQAVKTVAQGANASKISASGRTSSDIRINGVQQLAKAATYRISGGALNGGTASMDKVSATAGGTFYLDGPQEVSNVAGELTIAYGGSKARSYLDLKFGELDNFANASEMAASINKQLAEQSVTTSSGESKKAIDMLEARVDSNGNIEFVDTSGAKNEIFISSASGKLKDNLGVKTGSGQTTIQTSVLSGSGSVGWTKTMNTQEYLGGSSMEITLDGVTKKIAMPSKDEIIAELDKSYKYYDDVKAAIEGDRTINGAEARQQRDDAYIRALQKKIDKQFGTLSDGSSKLVVKDALADDKKAGEEGAVKGIQLSFEAQPGSSFHVAGDKAAAMGLGKEGVSSYMSTNTTLGEILGDKLNTMEKVIDEKTGEVKKDDNGNDLYAFVLNGEKIGEYSKDTSLGTIMTQINGNKAAGVNVSYSRSTNEFTFTTKDGGKAGGIEFGDGIAKTLFGDTKAAIDGPDDKTTFSSGATYTKGQDAIFHATINGKDMTLTRSSNTVEMDGMTFTLKGEFGYKKDENGDLINGADGKPELDPNAEAVTFSTSADADKVVDAIKSMVDDYNAMVTEIKNAYSTLPAQKSNGAYYEPLTEEDKADMSESAINSWEEKAKAGILFGDRDLSSLYGRLTSAASMYGQDAADLKAAGITLNYANGLTTLSFNENQLRATLETDPDRVADIFTKNTDSGSSTKGFLQSIKEPLDLYGKTTGVNLSTGTKGVLVNKAGHPLAPSTMYNNTIQQQLDKIDKEIEKWQDKMSDQVDYYTTQFSKLEQLISQMNSQSSTLAGLMGSY